MSLRRIALLLAVLLAAASCSSDGGGARRVLSSPDPSPRRTSSPAPEATASPRSTARVTAPTATPTARPADLASARVKLSPVATVESPVAMAVRAGDAALYVAQRAGTIRAIRGGRVDPVVVLDISREVSLGGERGLLGLAFHPGGEYLYVNFTDRAGDTVIREYRFSGSRAESGTARQVLTLDQPAANHNGGNLAFGRDGFLYIGTGDGGGAGDPRNWAQNLGTLFGKMLRIDPRPSGGQPYRVPPDNPFVNRQGARKEIWAYGLRNPWRYSFDRQTGDLWIGDVGQYTWEEVDFQPGGSKGGENYGWDRMEGTHSFEGATPPPDHVPPVHEYGHESGNGAITGGYVYRGERIPGLRGAYLYADFFDGRVKAFLLRDGRPAGLRDLGIAAERLVSFGEDGAGELYVLTLDGNRLFRIDPA